MKQLIAAVMLSTTSFLTQAALLYSNGPVVDGDNLSILAPTASIYGFGAQTASNNAVADNFSIAAGETWMITDLDFFSYQTGATGFTFENVSWSIIAGDVNNGTVIASDINTVTNGGLQGYRVTASTTTDTNRGIYLANADIDDLFLGAGDYWLRWSLTGSLSSGPWVPVLSDARTGDAQQSVDDWFETLVDSGSQLTVELPFALNGSATTSEVSEPAMLALLGFGLLSVAGARRRKKTL